MKRFFFFIICTILCLSAAEGRRHHSHFRFHSHYHGARMKPSDARDTLNAPVNIADSIIYEATKHLGKPYRSGNKGPYAFDCSGFTGYVYRQFGFSLGASSSDQYLQGVRISTENVHKGDLVFFTGHNSRGGIGHVGIVFDVDPINHSFRFIHAANGSGIRIDRYPDAFYYTRRFRGLRRIINYNESRFAPPLFAANDAAINNSVDLQPQNKLDLSIAAESNKHKVRRGETLYRIAHKYNCSIADLRKWNHLSGRQRVRPGQTLVIRQEKDVNTYLQDARKEVAAEDVNANDIKVSVKRGESVYSLSQKYNCTIKELVTWNNLHGNRVDEGQELVIRPSKTVANSPVYAGKPNANTITLTVSEGETIFSLARKYHCTSKDIKEWNNLTSSRLKTGQTLVIKGENDRKKEAEEKAKAKEQAIEEERKKIDNGNTHTVQTGETLAAIGRNYKCSTAELIKWNHLRNAKIRVGQIIKIRPGNAEYVATRTYSKKKGESDTNNGETANNAETNSNEEKTGKTSTETSTHSDARPTKSHNQSIKAGSTNDTSASSPNAYKVKRGETIFQLAKRYHCTVRDLKKWNRLRSCKLRPGQQLIIKNGQNSQIQESEKTNIGNENKADEKNINSDEQKEEIAGKHTVAKGETIYRIAKENNCSVEQIQKWNHLRTRKLKVGQTIIVKGGQATKSSSASDITAKGQKSEIAQSTPSDTTNSVTTPGMHIVGKGETIYHIARSYHCSIGQIQRWNHLHTRKLKVGQSLVIKSKK